MSPQKLSKELLQSLCGDKNLKEVEKLDLSNKNLDSIDPLVFEELKVLKHLDLSQNNLSYLPVAAPLKTLKLLNVSSNNLSSLEFVKHLPQLRELYVMQNRHIWESDKLIATILCPSLITINSRDTSEFQLIIENKSSALNLKILAIWEALFKSKYSDPVLDTEVGEMTAVIIKTVEKAEYAESDKTYKFLHCLIEQLTKDFLEQVRHGKYQQNKRKVKKSLKFIEAETSMPAKSKKNEEPMSKSIPGRKHGVKHSARHKFTVIREKTFSKDLLPLLPDYEPVHFIRCHSENNDPDDSITKVWHCAFKPKPDGTGEASHTLATCGGKIVSLIDCNTGKILKRYKDSDPSESFYTLAWTKLPINKKEKFAETNILAVAGESQEVKLIHPAQLVMYANLYGHTRYISTLYFHPNHPSWLFSGAADRKIILWDIGTPDFSTYKTRHSRLLVLESLQGVLNIVFNSTLSWLVAGCEDGCYGWKLDGKSVVGKSRTPSVSFCLPHVVEDMCVDGMVLLPNDIIASKCVEEGVIYLWSLKHSVPSSTKSVMKEVEAEVLFILEYVSTEQSYILLGNTAGILTVGSDMGHIYLYDIRKLERKKRKDALLVASRIIEWPEVTYPSSDAKEKKVIINNAILSHDQIYLASGTDNNLVCIWKEVQ